MRLDGSGLEILGEDECRELLTRAPIGRIVFTHQALPAIQPVNFQISGDDIVVKTSQGSRLATAAVDTVVAFEVDEFDAGERTGWSVVVIGRAQRVDDSREFAALNIPPLDSWAPVERDTFIRIRSELITGRRIGTGARPLASP